jgi:glutathione S-transferase
VLEHVQPEPALYPPPLKGVSRVFAQWADSTLFWASMAYNLSPRGAAEMFANAPPDAARAFAEDRKAMSGGMTRLRPGDAASAYRSYLRRIAHMVEEHDFLFGAAPCIADFAAYHPLWFTRTRVPGMASILDATPAVLEWMDRMAALGPWPLREAQRGRRHRGGPGGRPPARRCQPARRQRVPGRSRPSPWVAGSAWRRRASGPRPPRAN